MKRADLKNDPTPNRQILAGWQRLIAALLKNALSDAKSGDQESVEWLRGDGLLWLEWLGIRQPAIGLDRLLNPTGKIVLKIFRSDYV